MSRRFILLFLSVAGILAYRLTLGVNFTDEAYYAAMALRFSQGDLPFVDELFVHQTGATLILPFVKTYLYFFGTTGLILYLRFLYWLFCLGLGGLIFYCLRTLDLRARGAASLMALLFIPLYIPALSYNTLGAGLFAATLFLGFSYLREGGQLNWVAAMLCLALSEYAYPTLLAPGFLFLLLVFKAERKHFLWKAYFLCHLAVAIAFFPYVWNAGPGIIASYVYTTEAHHHWGGIEKALAVARFIIDSSLFPIVFAAYCTLAIGLRHRWFLPLFPLLLGLAFFKWNYSATWIFLHFALAAPILYSIGPREKSDRELLHFVWLPSAAAGFLSGWMSASSAANLTIGLWAGGMTSAFFLLRAWPRRVTSAALLSTFLFSLFYGHVFYCDGEFSRLTRRVGSGPFRYLATTSEKIDYLEKITADIRLLENEEGKIIFYEFPAGYLLSSMRIGVNSAWMRTESLGKLFYVRHYLARASRNDLVFKLKILDHGFLSPVTYSSHDPFLKLLEESFDSVLETPLYDVFRPKAEAFPLKITGLSTTRS